MKLSCQYIANGIIEATLGEHGATIQYGDGLIRIAAKTEEDMAAVTGYIHRRIPDLRVFPMFCNPDCPYLEV